MAKGSAMGLWRGKKGSTVFYKLTNSNNAQKQGIRERVYEVANPQSNGQATQRAKLLPAQRVAGVLREIVERGWQGVDYGAKSRSEFLKRALKMSSGYPYVLKDDDRIVPGKYQITKGTITPVTCSYDDGIYVSNLFMGDVALSTIGEASQALIDNNANINEGDQITFVVCTSEGGTAVNALDRSFNWTYLSFYVDPASTEDVNSIGDSIAGIGFGYSADDGEPFQLAVSANADANTMVIAAACVISRLSDSGSYMRSSATIALMEEILAPWFSSAQRNRARESYQTANAATTNTNWPVDGEAEFEGTYVTQVILAGLTGNIAQFNGRPVAVRARESDDTLVAVYYKLDESEGENPCVVSPEGNVYTYSVEMEPSALRVNQCPQVSDLQLVLWR